MSDIVKKKLLAVLAIFIVAVIMQFMLKTNSSAMSWLGLVLMAAATMFLYISC